MKIWTFILLIWVLLLFIPADTFAQSHGVLFSSLKKKDGLANNVVRCITQDSKGFIWFGTEVGLSRYDGNRSMGLIKQPMEGYRGILNIAKEDVIVELMST